MISTKKLLYKTMEAINGIKQTITTASIVNMVHPVGSYYETSDTTFDPNTAWGGTWVLEEEGLVHIGAGATYTVGATGGEKTHKLTINEMPRHTHALLFYGNGSYSFGYNFGNKGYSSNVDSSSSGISDVGGGQAHNIMQPYIVVNRWHRTA